MERIRKNRYRLHQTSLVIFIMAAPTLRPIWFDPNPPKLSPVTLELFEKYTNLPADAVLPHLLAIVSFPLTSIPPHTNRPQRERAWEVFPYPCIGSFRFLDFGLSTSTLYPAIVARLQAGATLLDLGCCFGQDLRKLVHDGVPSENLFGADLLSEFIDLGYDLFGDRDALRTTFLAPADVFDDADDAPLTLMPRVDVVHIGSFLHLFEYADQVRAVRKIAALLKPGKGSVVIGQQVGSLNSGEYPHPTNPKRIMFHHDAATFEKLWAEAGGEWDVKAELHEADMATEEYGKRARVFFGEGVRWLRFSVTRK